MTGTPTDDLLERLKDPDYAKLYGEENAKVDFAITLTKARKNLNLTQKSLADKLGISQPYVAKLESGEANPTLGRIGSMLATIDLRLVTGTAPLKPEPMPFSAGLVLTGAIGAADVGVNVSVLVNNPYGADYGNICFPAVGLVKDLPLAREAVEGGAAR